MELKCGMIVKSIAGHDKDRFYLVVDIKSNRAYIADGKLRSVEFPKAKNFIHLKKTKEVVNLKDFSTNKQVRKLLHSYNY